MSHVNLYIKKDGTVKRYTAHDFMIKGILLHGMDETEIETFFKRAVKEDLIEPYDSGLFYIDVDKRAIVSAQSDFTLQELEKAVGKKLTKGWKYAELQPEAVTPQLILASLQ